MLIKPWLRTWNRDRRSKTSSRKTVIVISVSPSVSRTLLKSAPILDVGDVHQRTSHFSRAVNWRCTLSVSRSNPLSTESFSSLDSGARTQSVCVSR